MSVKDDTRLYLLTLEVVPLAVGEVYNPLPSHLTLVSRFWSEQSPKELSDALRPLFAATKPVQLLLEGRTELGPHSTPVHLVQNTPALHTLHMRACEALDGCRVEYTQPQFIRAGHQPHISMRSNDGFVAGLQLISRGVYLVEVHIRGKEHLRTIRTRFDLV